MKQSVIFNYMTQSVKGEVEWENGIITGRRFLSNDPEVGWTENQHQIFRPYWYIDLVDYDAMKAIVKFIEKEDWENHLSFDEGCTDILQLVENDN